jgi:hypothetical protein
MGQPSQKAIVVDYSPELIDGVATDSQTAKEFVFLFTHVLKGYGVSFQLANFIWKIYERTKPGVVYQMNDVLLADAYGSTRNYVCNLRKALTDWNAGEYEDGSKHYQFVSIIQNRYDKTKKRQDATGYCFSQKFEDLLRAKLAATREHKLYKENWMKAARIVCSDKPGPDFLDLGTPSYKRQTRWRSADEILGTLLLNWRRTAYKLVAMSYDFGCEPGEVKTRLEEMLPAILTDACSAAIDHLAVQSKTPEAVYYRGPGSFTKIFKRAIEYSNTREAEESEDFFQRNAEHSFFRDHSWVGGENNDRSSILGRGAGGVAALDKPERNVNGSGASVDRLLERGQAAGSSGRKASVSALDRERELFLAKHSGIERR